MEYIVYCDESIQDGKYYSNFYGGALVKSVDLNYVQNALNSATQKLNLNREIKWSKVTANYLDKYIDLMDIFMNLVAEERIKTRIMFTQNCNEANGLEREHHDNRYFLLYYQFIKHAFGLQFSNLTDEDIRVRLYFDQFPDKREKVNQFKSYLKKLNTQREFRIAKVYIDEEQITEIKSHNHIILQCLDVVLGSMQFKLNDKHKIKPEGASRRSSRTIAKEKLYKHINQRIREIYPNFNVGVNTSYHADKRNIWLHPYRHWLFMPNNSHKNLDRTKQKMCLVKG